MSLHSQLRVRLRANKRLREWAGIALISTGIAGLVVPVIPGLALIAAGTAVLGPDHAVVKRGRGWLERRGILKRPKEEAVGSMDSPEVTKS